MKRKILKEVLESEEADDKEMMLLCKDIEQAGEHKQNAKKACARNLLWRAFHRNVKLHEEWNAMHGLQVQVSACIQRGTRPELLMLVAPTPCPEQLMKGKLKVKGRIRKWW